MLFIGMLATQLAGALILLLNCAVGNRKAVIQNCFPGSNFVEPDDDDNCIIPKGKLQASAHALYLNMVAFADLVVGYLIAAFSPVATLNTKYTVAGVVVVTVAFLLLEYCLSRLIAKKVYAKDMKISYSELNKNDVDAFASDKDIQKILEM